MFKPITSKLDDAALGNLKLPALQRKRANKKMTVPDYGISLYDENIPDYGLDDLFDEDGVQPEQNKQLLAKPPSSKESLLVDKIKEGNKSMLILNIYQN